MTARPTSPARGRSAIRVHLFGKYQHRQPLAYEPVRAACSGRIELTGQIAEADMVIVAHIKDVESFGTGLRKALHSGQRLVLLSEEPFWDTIWGADPFTRAQTCATAEGPLPLTVLNHGTSAIYDFARIPYFLLTDPRFSARYAIRYARNATRDRDSWRNHFKARREIHFMAERRQNARYDISFPDKDVHGLAAVRTRIANACKGTHVFRQGKGWPAHQIDRQALPYWHLDKLQSLDGQCLILSAIENTHQWNYITEKLFDAFAVGAVPLYIAGPEHRVHDLVPKGSWINLHGLDAEAAAARTMDFRPDVDFLDAYAAAQQRLAETFCNGRVLKEELARFADALAAECEEIVSHS